LAVNEGQYGTTVNIVGHETNTLKWIIELLEQHGYKAEIRYSNGRPNESDLLINWRQVK